MPEFICIGHRGACGHKPENTLGSFAYAIELGCTWLELDVYAVQDELLVIHDDTLERTTNGSGDVMEHDVGYLRELDAGGGQQIPTLDEVVRLVDRRCVINIELKGPGTAGPVCEYLNRLCEGRWQAEDFLLSSFYHAELALADLQYRRGALFGKARTDYFERTAKLAAWSINVSTRLVNEQLVGAAHDRDLKVFVYTVNEPAEMLKMQQIGVDGVFTDYPDRFFDAIQNRSD